MPVKSKKTNKRKAPVKKAVKVVYPKHIYGTHKSFTHIDADFQMSPDTNKIGNIVLSTLEAGDLYHQRANNTIWINNCQVSMNMRNAAGSSRYMRVMALTLTNNIAAPNVTTFPELFTLANFVSTQGPSGNAEDVLLQINRQLFKPLYDKVVKIPGLANGESNSKNFTFNIPIKKFVSYESASDIARKNPIYLLWIACESEGISKVGAPLLYSSYRVTTHFKDLIK